MYPIPTVKKNSEHGRLAAEARNPFASYLTEFPCLTLRKRSRIDAAALALVLPGKTALLMLSPRARAGVQAQSDLVSELLAKLSGRDLHFCQALVEPDEEARSAPLVRNGFEHLTRLEYLDRSGTYPWFDPPPPAAARPAYSGRY